MATAVVRRSARSLMELIRWYGRTRGDIALAMLFYGGMAGGVMLINLAPTGSNANLTSYLFGSLSTVSEEDVTAICLLAAFVVLVTLGLRRQLFAVSQDEEFARVTGLPVRALNLLHGGDRGGHRHGGHAGRRPAAGQRADGGPGGRRPAAHPQLRGHLRGRGGHRGDRDAGGTVTSYYQDVPPGATIVLLAIAAFLLLTALATPLARRRARAVERTAGDPAECVIPEPGKATVPVGRDT